MTRRSHYKSKVQRNPARQGGRRTKNSRSEQAQNQEIQGNPQFIHDTL